MFFPEQIKKITQFKDTDGFLYFDPQEEIESSLAEEEAETAEIRASLKTQHKFFLLSNLVVAIVNIAILGYWAAKIDDIYNYEASEDKESQDHPEGHILSIVIMVLMVMQFIWVLNSVLGYIFLRYELNFGIISYFVILNVVLFTRIALNLFVIVARRKLREILGDSFIIVLYLICLLAQILGDVLLAILAARIKYTIKNLTNIFDKKLYSETISNVTVL